MERAPRRPHHPRVGHPHSAAENRAIDSRAKLVVHGTARRWRPSISCTTRFGRSPRATIGDWVADHSRRVALRDRVRPPFRVNIERRSTHIDICHALVHAIIWPVDRRGGGRVNIFHRWLTHIKRVFHYHARHQPPTGRRGARSVEMTRGLRLCPFCASAPRWSTCDGCRGRSRSCPTKPPRF